MYAQHAWVRTPTNHNISIWRYFKPERFFDLLESGQLHFARLDQFPDAFEGVLPLSTSPLVKDQFRHAPRNPGDELTDWEAYVQWFNRAGKRAHFANCWFMNEYESAGMWSLYGRGGIAVRSTFDRLCASLANEPEAVHVGEVKYLDFRKDQPPTYGNTLAVAYTKQREYEHERELRAVVVKPPREEGRISFSSPFCPDSHCRGLRIAVDLDILIECVYVAPGRLEFFKEDVRAALQRRGLDKPARGSVLDERPVLL